MKTTRSNFGVNVMAALALFGAVLTVVVLFFAFNAAGARPTKMSDLGTVLFEYDALEQCRGVVDGTAQTQWTDLSGNGYHAAQATGANQPTCQTAAGDLVNGKPVLDFDGTDSFEAAVPNTAQPVTVFVVADFDAVNAVAYLFDGATARNAGGVTASGLDFSFAGSQITSTTGPTANTTYVWAFVFNGASSAIYRDGVLSVTGNAGAAALEVLKIGTRNDDSGNRFNGQYSALVGFTGALSDVNRIAVEKLLRKKWTGGSIPVPAFLVSGKLPAKQKQGNCTDANVALWEDFEEASGNLTVPAGCAASGTVLTANGNPVYQSDSGEMSGLDRAITFDGTGDYFAAAADVDTLDLGTNAAVWEVWIKPTASGVIASKYNFPGGNAAGWELLVNSGLPRINVGDGTAASGCVATGAGASIVDGGWHHVRATWNGTNICTLKLDDRALVSTTLAQGSASTANIPTVGARTGGGVTFTGSIADLRITIGNATNDLGFNGPAYSGVGSTLTVPTFTRATASTRVNPVTGLVETVASGVPVVGSPLSGGDDGSIDGTEPTGVYVGSATTFLLANNEDMSNASWTASSVTVTANQDTAPDGTTTADKLAPSSGTNSYLYEDPAGAGDCAGTDTCTATFWLRSATGANVSTSLHIYNGIATPRQQCPITVTTTWQKFVCTGTGLADDSLVAMIGGGSVWVTGEDIYAWRGQFYEKAFAVPLDPAVAGTAVTVNADKVSYGASVLPSWSQFSVCSWVNKSTSATQEDLWGLTGGSGGSDFKVRFAASTTAPRANVVGCCEATASTNITTSTWGHVCASYDDTTERKAIYVNGGTPVVETTAYTAGTGHTFYIGSSNNDFQLEGLTSDVRVYSSALSPQQIRALYLSKSSLYATRDETPREKLRRTVMLASARLENPFAFFSPWFDERARRAEDIATAKRVVASPRFPQPAFVMPQEVSP